MRVEIALLGFGTVGSGVFEILEENRKRYREMFGIDIHVKTVLVRSSSLELEGTAVTTDFAAILNDEEISVVVEVMGSIEPAYSYIKQSIEHGKHVVSANKDLVSVFGPDIFALAKKHGCRFLFEASVAGGIPVIDAVVHSLQGDKLISMIGILNGTSNYMLTQMEKELMSFSEALKKAQVKGFAEADPRNDVEGFDSAYKTSILTSLMWNCHVPQSAISCQGISGISKEDIAYIKALGYHVKLMAYASKSGDQINISVQPLLVSRSSLWANVNDAGNAILLHGEYAGDIILYGQGAGKLPTANAVVSDVLKIVSGQAFAAGWSAKNLTHIQAKSFKTCFVRAKQADPSWIVLKAVDLGYPDELGFIAQHVNEASVIGVLD